MASEPLRYGTSDVCDLRSDTILPVREQNRVPMPDNQASPPSIAEAPLIKLKLKLKRPLSDRSVGDGPTTSLADPAGTGKGTLAPREDDGSREHSDPDCPSHKKRGAAVVSDAARPGTAPPAAGGLEPGYLTRGGSAGTAPAEGRVDTGLQGGDRSAGTAPVQEGAAGQVKGEGRAGYEPQGDTQVGGAPVPGMLMLGGADAAAAITPAAAPFAPAASGTMTQSGEGSSQLQLATVASGELAALGAELMGFGYHRHQTRQWVCENDPGYCVWALKQSHPSDG